MTTFEDPTEPRNDPAHDTVYTGSVHAFSATGGFIMERRFDDIKRAEQTAPVYVDVTNALQITMDVKTFNDKLGDFDPITDAFAVDEIELTAEEFTAGVTNAAQIISLGKYESLYEDFQAYVASYFDIPGGFSSLFEKASEFSIDTENEFTADSFIALLTGVAADPSGRYISDLSGSISISNIAKILKYSVDSNIFGNRDPEAGEEGDRVNWGVENKFVPGDLIWVPDGTTVTLKLAIDAEAFAPINNNSGTNQSGTLSQNQSTTFTGVNISLETEASNELITRVAKVPLLIKLIRV